MENSNDQQDIFAHFVEDAMLPIPPSSQAKPAVFVDLSCFGMFAKKREGLGHARVISIARYLAMNSGAVGQNVEQVRVGSDAEVKPLHAPSGMRCGFGPGYVC